MLDRKKRYLQVALNSTPYEGESIISQLPPSDRILIEAGTPLIKAYGADGIRHLKRAWQYRLGGMSLGFTPRQQLSHLPAVLQAYGYNGSSQATAIPQGLTEAYVVADTKCMDRGRTEVQIAADGGANAATVLGAAPLETIDYFIASCRDFGLDSMVDMIGVTEPVKVLRKLKRKPTVVILHRGVDEEHFDKHKPIPYVQINKILSGFDVMISIAGGDTSREVQRAVFNGAGIVVVWKNFYNLSSDTASLAEEFLREIK